MLCLARCFREHRRHRRVEDLTLTEEHRNSPCLSISSAYSTITPAKLVTNAYPQILVPYPHHAVSPFIQGRPFRHRLSSLGRYSRVSCRPQGSSISTVRQCPQSPSITACPTRTCLRPFFAGSRRSSQLGVSDWRRSTILRRTRQGGLVKNQGRKRTSALDGSTPKLVTLVAVVPGLGLGFIEVHC